MKKTEIVDIITDISNCIFLKVQKPMLPNLTAKDWDKVLSLAQEQGVLPVIAPLLTD